MAVLLALPVLGGGARAEGGTPTVAVAANLYFAIAEIGEAFARETGLRVRFSFGSSGNITRQIEQGAPFQAFLSADPAYARRLEAKGLTEGAGAGFAEGGLVLFAARASALAPDPALRGLKAAVAAGRIRRFAIANPEHAPYGRAAKDVLERAGLWRLLQGRLVMGENASQAAQFAVQAGVDGGLVPYSLVLGPGIGQKGRHSLVPREEHRPLVQWAVALKGAGEAARRFLGFLGGAGARAILEKYGFTPPRDGE